MLKKALTWKTLLAILAVLAVTASVLLTAASPLDFTVQEIDGKTCVITDVYIECWCKGECTLPSFLIKETPTDVPDPDPQPTPKPQPTPVPTDEPVTKCNRGLGNGAEACDPGNSSGKPGAAGEGDG